MKVAIQKCYYRETNYLKYDGFLIRNHGDQKTVEQHLKYWKIKLSTHNSTLAKIFFINEGQTKIFSDERKLREFITSRPAIKELLKEVYLDKYKKYFSPLKVFKVLKVESGNYNVIWWGFQCM